MGSLGPKGRKCLCSRLPERGCLEQRMPGSHFGQPGAFLRGGWPWLAWKGGILSRDPSAHSPAHTGHHQQSQFRCLFCSMNDVDAFRNSFSLSPVVGTSSLNGQTGAVIFQLAWAELPLGTKCCGKGKGLLWDLYEKQTFYLKTKTIITWQHQGSLWAFNFCSWCLMSTGASLKEILNILMIFVPLAIFLKDVHHCTVIFRDTAFVFHWKTWIDVWGVSCGLYLSLTAPTINSKKSN